MATELEQVMERIKGIESFVTQKVEAGTKPLQEEYARLTQSFTKALADLEQIKHQRLAGTDDYGVPKVRIGRLAGFDLTDLRLLERILVDRQNNGVARHDALLAEVRSQRVEVVKGITLESVMAWEDHQVERKRIALGAFPGAPYGRLQAFRRDLMPLKRAMISMVTKAALDSTTTSAGDELVPTFEATALWMDVNLETKILPLLPQTPMPTNPFDIPNQFGDTNWYPADENVQVTTTAPATAKTTLTAYGLKTGVPFSDELEEDAIIAFVAELRSNLARNAAEIIDDVLLNADTAATNNINADSATISKSTAGKAQWLLGFKGIRILPLSDNTAQRVDANAALAIGQYVSVLTKMGRFAVPQERGNVAFITDINTAIKSLSLTSVLTLDVAGARATLSTGELAQVFGHPLIISEQFLLQDTDGKVTSAGNVTNTGSILGLNSTQWRVGFRRQITMETQREAGKGQTTMYVSFRIALTERTGTRSSATHTALVFDITGVNT